MGQFRCLQCRTIPLAGHRFCYVCGAPFPGPVPAAAVRAEAEVEGSIDILRVTKIAFGLAGLLMLGIAKSLISDFDKSWALGALLLIAGACSVVWALQPKGDRTDTAGMALDFIRTAVLYLLLACAVGGGIVILLVATCRSILGKTG
jgi:uncharacterized membrane protein HdeD (DUF308 family)